MQHSAALGVGDVDVTRLAPDLMIKSVMFIVRSQGSYQGLYHRGEGQPQVQGGLAIPAHNVHHLSVVLQDLVHSNHVALRYKYIISSKVDL